jgi:predicted ATPase
MAMFIRKLTLKNFLSFGPDSPPVALRALNVLIGANGSGKSNLIEAIGFLRAAPDLLVAPVRDGGGVRDWLWKGESNPTASVEAVVDRDPLPRIRHSISFTTVAQRFELCDERIENEQAAAGQTQPYFYYRYQDNHPVLNVRNVSPGGDGTGDKAAYLSADRAKRFLKREDVDPEKSILAQRKDPDSYPEITDLAAFYTRIRIYREWSFGRYPPPRLPQKADQRNDFLLENCENLGLVLNRLRSVSEAKRALIDGLRQLYEGVDDVDVAIQGGTVQVLLQEGRFTIPATRLSDGTLRYLCLLAILCDPAPPPLICIEEPELGLHPDALSALGPLLIAASQRSQIAVTTHSRQLVDHLSQQPDSIVVCDKQNGSTIMHRLDAGTLKDWLEKYSLGDLWEKGEIGGVRW